MDNIRRRVAVTLNRFEGRLGFTVLQVAWRAHRNPEMGVFENSDVTRIAREAEGLTRIPYGGAARVTREMVGIGALEHVGGQRPKKYALTEVGAKALGQMARSRSKPYLTAQNSSY